MPVTRLQPLPFPEPARFIAYIEEEPSIIEEGLRVVARRLPLPGAAPSVVVDLLALDGQDRITVIQIGARLTPGSLAHTAAAHQWIDRNLATLRQVCPPVAGASESARSILITGTADPSLDGLLDRLAPPAPEVFHGSLFLTSTGPAVSLRRLGAPAPAEAGLAGMHPGAGPGAGDPLAGIPISSAELAEFRRLVSSSRSRADTARRKGKPPQPPPAGSVSATAAVEN